MNSPFSWDIVSLMIIAIVFFATIFKHMTEGQENRSFLAFQVSVFFMAVFDLVSEILNRNPVDEPWWLPAAYITTYLFFIIRHLVNVIYLLYIISIAGIRFKLYRTVHRVLILMPYVTIVMMILSNLFSGEMFTITFEEGYKRGDGILYIYLFGWIYSAIGLYYLVRIRHYIDLHKWIILILMYVMALAVMAWQGLHEGLLVEMLAYALALLLNHLLVLRPEEILDVNVDMYSWRYYREHLRHCEIAGHPLKIVVIRYFNTPEVRSIFGEKNYNSYMRDLAKRIRGFLKNKKEVYTLFYGPVGCVCIAFDDMAYDEGPLMRFLLDKFEELRKDELCLASIMQFKYAVVRFLVDIRHAESMMGFTVRFPSFIPLQQECIEQKDFESNSSFKLRNHINSIINRALNDNNFEMYYQPIYDLRSDTFATAEALIRLNDPKYGFVPPALFIREAENCGLIKPIGDFVLESVHEFLSSIRQEDLGVRYVEINLSVHQCTHIGLADYITGLGKKYEVPPEMVNLEITESVNAVNPEAFMENMGRLVEMGYSFALDDYGTGFSNVARLLKMPLKIVKIDKSVIDTIGDERSMSVVENTVRMMHGIGLEVVCEGVETKEQVMKLKNIGCDYIQGYFYSKPLPRDEYVRFLKKHKEAKSE
ncbi:MAG: EAL domain-containing protein [Lachnospiraceae bacterium]|nr:EAL domain-containing protein [Lachnospiraceae bacterium]